MTLIKLLIFYLGYHVFFAGLLLHPSINYAIIEFRKKPQETEKNRRLR